MGDFAVSPPAPGAYDRSSSPKYYVEFSGAGHFAWTDLNPKFQALIVRYSVAFFDAYLRDGGDTAPLSALVKTPFPQGVGSVKTLP